MPAALSCAMVFSWFLVVGAVLILMAFASRWVSRLPLSFAVVYLAAGFAIGPAGLGLLRVDLAHDAGQIEVLAEVAVLISLFALGLRLRLPLAWHVWRTPIKLATVTMALTVAGLALVAHAALGLPWPAALLLGAVLGPTDPVLASDVQVRHPGDRDALRVALTAEAGLNDGTAFPAVLLALMLASGAADLGRWLLHDVAWAVASGIALGAGCGIVMAKAVARLRRSGLHPEFEEFLALGLIAMTYGTGLVIGAYGFIAVFVAGLSFARTERRSAPGASRQPAGIDVHPDALSEAETSNRLLTFSTQCERLAEVGLVLVVGAALASVAWTVPVLILAGALILVVRPIAVTATVHRNELSTPRRRALSWFGIRGIGSLYYAAYALNHGGDGPAWANDLVNATLASVAISIGAHGISATPLMRRVPGGRHRDAGGRPH